MLFFWVFLEKEQGFLKDVKLFDLGECNKIVKSA